MINKKINNDILDNYYSRILNSYSFREKKTSLHTHILFFYLETQECVICVTFISYTGRFSTKEKNIHLQILAALRVKGWRMYVVNTVLIRFTSASFRIFLIAYPADPTGVR